MSDEERLDESFDGTDLNDTNDSDFVLTAERTAKKRKPRKVKHDWTDEQILRLITAVQERPSLWDAGATEYKLPKNDIWQEVADICGNFTRDDAKIKWGNLRVIFKQNMTKHRKKKSGQGTNESTAVVWRFFKAMLFLEAGDVNQSTQSTSSFKLVFLPFLCQ